MRIALRIVVLVGCTLTNVPGAVFAQTNGRLEGTVRDTSGDVVPGATVTIAGPPLTGSRTSVTDERGQYAFDGLPAGRYLVTTTLSGFQSSSREIDLGGPATLDFELAVSSVFES